MSRPTASTECVAIGFAAVALAWSLAPGCAAPERLPPDPAFADVAWIAGTWAGEDDDGVRTEEHWTAAPAGGTMFGVNRVVAGDRTVFFEHLRIERGDDGGLVYLASPAGRQPPTPFRLVDASADRVVFENPDHDFPQRIVYERQAGDLHLHAWGVENGQARTAEWRLHRVPPR